MIFRHGSLDRMGIVFYSLKCKTNAGRITGGEWETTRECDIEIAGRLGIRDRRVSMVAFL